MPVLRRASWRAASLGSDLSVMTKSVGGGEGKKLGMHGLRGYDEEERGRGEMIGSIQASKREGQTINWVWSERRVSVVGGRMMMKGEFSSLNHRRLLELGRQTIPHFWYWGAAAGHVITALQGLSEPRIWMGVWWRFEPDYLSGSCRNP